MTNVCVFACVRAHVRTCVCLYMCVCMVWYCLPLCLLPSPSPCLADQKPNIRVSLVFRLSLSLFHSLALMLSRSSLPPPLPHLLSHCSCRFMYETMTGRDTPSIGGHRQRHTLTGEKHPHRKRHDRQRHDRQRHDRQRHTLHRGPQREQGSKDCCLWCFQIGPLCLLPVEDKICVCVSSKRQRKPQTRRQTRKYTGRHLLLKKLGLRVCAGQLLMTPAF